MFYTYHFISDLSYLYMTYSARSKEQQRVDFFLLSAGLGVTVRIFEVMMKCAEKQPLGSHLVITLGRFTAR